MREGHNTVGLQLPHVIAFNQSIQHESNWLMGGLQYWGNPRRIFLENFYHGTNFYHMHILHANCMISHCFVCFHIDFKRFGLFCSKITNFLYVSATSAGYTGCIGCVVYRTNATATYPVHPFPHQCCGYMGYLELANVLPRVGNIHRVLQRWKL